MTEHIVMDSDDNINIEQALTVVKTNEGICWKDLIKIYVKLFGAINYEDLKQFILMKIPENFISNFDGNKIERVRNLKITIVKLKKGLCRFKNNCCQFEITTIQDING